MRPTTDLPTEPNPIHCGACPDHVAWSTINAGEALPGVVTPLTWSFYGDAVERAMRGAFCDLGVLRPSEVRASPAPEDRLWDLFYGRAAGNLNTFRWLADRMPGTNGNAVEEQIFGQVRPGMENEPVYRRYPTIALKLPVAAARVRPRLRAATAGIDRWWRASMDGSGATAQTSPLALLEDAASRFESVMRPHTLAAMLCQSLYEQVRVVAERAGRPGLEIHLVTGYGDMAETDVVADLWDVSRDRLSLDEFVARHGYHGPDEGELASRSWRMRREPLERLLEPYRDMEEERNPRNVEQRRAADRRRAEEEVLAALPTRRRAQARAVLAIAGRLIPLRGFGKAAFLQCVDVGRSAARAYGEELAAAGVLEDPEDVFMLTLAELREGPTVRDGRVRARAARDVRAVPRGHAAGPVAGHARAGPCGRHRRPGGRDRDGRSRQPRRGDRHGPARARPRCRRAPPAVARCSCAAPPTRAGRRR